MHQDIKKYLQFHLFQYSLGITDLNTDIIGNTLDTNNCLQNIVYDGLGPLLYTKTKNNPSFSKEANIIIQNSYYTNLSKNIQLLEKAKQVISILKQSDIDTILLKGIAMVSYYYADVALRPMSDIDILINEADIEKAESILSEKGLINTNKQAHFIKSLKIGHNIPMSFNGTLIEIHWRVLNSSNKYQLPLTEFWRKAKIINLSDVETKIFAPENMIQHASVHIKNHLTSTHVRLNWWLDIALIIEKETIDWNYLALKSKEFGILEPLFDLLFVIKELFKSPIPDDFFETMSNEHKKTCLHNFELLLLKENNRINVSTHLSYRNKINSIKGFRNKINYFICEIFPPKQMLLQHYNKYRKTPILLLYIANIYRLFRKVIKNIFR